MYIGYNKLSSLYRRECRSTSIFYRYLSCLFTYMIINNGYVKFRDIKRLEPHNTTIIIVV
jgi:hypothetical protein